MTDPATLKRIAETDPALAARIAHWDACGVYVRMWLLALRLRHMWGDA